MRVLIVEDDAALGLFLSKGLGLQGYQVQHETNGAAALELALAQPPDLLVLDLSLPGMDGLEILAALEGRCPGTSMLVLTGRCDVETKIRSFDLGADDCLAKPFSFNELMARCKALARRRRESTSLRLKAGSIELDRVSRRAYRDGSPVELTTKEFALLEYLMMAGGRTCLRSELLREVWHSSPSAGTNVVDVYVNYLRKKLGGGTAERGGERVIDTVRGEGYVMAGAGSRRKGVLPPGVHDSNPAWPQEVQARA